MDLFHTEEGPASADIVVEPPPHPAPFPFGGESKTGDNQRHADDRRLGLGACVAAEAAATAAAGTAPDGQRRWRRPLSSSSARRNRFGKENAANGVRPHGGGDGGGGCGSGGLAASSTGHNSNLSSGGGCGLPGGGPTTRRVTLGAVPCWSPGEVESKDGEMWMAFMGSKQLTKNKVMGLPLSKLKAFARYANLTVRSLSKAELANDLWEWRTQQQALMRTERELARDAERH